MKTTVFGAILIVILQSAIESLTRFIPLALRILLKLPMPASPKVRRSRQDIQSIDGQLKVTNMPETYTISVQDTKSMLPSIGLGHPVIMTKEFDVADLSKGECIHYMMPGHSNFHRIAGAFNDKKGLFFICKGDNCFFPDPYAIRPEYVKGLMLGVIH